MQAAQSTPSNTSVIVRDIPREMTAFMRGRPGCTRADLIEEGFSPRQIDQYGEAAARRASQAAVRRIA